MTADLHDMMAELETLKRNSAIYNSSTELAAILKDAGQLRRVLLTTSRSK